MNKFFANVRAWLFVHVFTWKIMVSAILYIVSVVSFAIAIAVPGARLVFVLVGIGCIVTKFILSSRWR